MVNAGLVRITDVKIMNPFNLKTYQHDMESILDVKAKDENEHQFHLEIDTITVDSLVDNGALHLCILEHIAIQLELYELYKREVTMADGKKHLVPYMGPIALKFKNRGCFTGTLVLGDEILLGAVPMKDMDVLISPAKQTLIVNPESPNIAMSIVKKFTSEKNTPADG